MKRAALLLPLVCLAAAAMAMDGRELIDSSLRRHAPAPYLYEEQALLLGDRRGTLGLRTLRHYALRDATGSHTLRVIETPAESRGSAFYLGRDATDGRWYGASPAAPLFGSNFSAIDLEPEQSTDFTYTREADHEIDRVPHHTLRAMPRADSVANATGYHARILYLRKDNLFVTRIDFQDDQGRPVRRLTFRDPRPEDSGAWRANMILIEDLTDGRRSLLKTERRVLSPDYVPSGVFDPWRAKP